MMPHAGYGYPPDLVVEMHQQAAWQATLETVLLQQAESNRLMAALLEQAVRPRAVKIVPDSIEHGSTGLWKTVSSGEAAPSGNWNGLHGDEMTWTIDFIVQAKNGAATAYPRSRHPVSGIPYDYAPYAVVTAGSGEVGGEPFELDVDLGGRVVVPGKNIAISLAMDAALPGYVSGTMTLGAYVGLFAAMSVAPVKRTRRTGAVGIGASSVAMLVPPRAKQIMPIRRSSASALGTMRVQDASGTNLDVFDITIVASVPLPLGAYQCVIDNTGSVVASYQVPFQIAV